MLRVTIRQVADRRPRAPKSAGVLDIEEVPQLPLFPADPARDYRIRLYTSPACSRRTCRRAVVHSFDLPASSPWHLVAAALAAVLPPPPT
jgi:hypothetical protein